MGRISLEQNAHYTVQMREILTTLDVACANNGRRIIHGCLFSNLLENFYGTRRAMRSSSRVITLLMLICLVIGR